ncbi:hypothetical protein SAMN04488516_102219 [Desulfonauticus submarinus]|uniref:Nucleoside recognition n=1 Tax=Desulfonauticus submarinus TaxID=206665 RepID=A0A1H0BLY9_9BACT|nr:hypothetical protein [Desulfonauticus submarinus]SDN46612.1 hypothetical protein SAMN04488516_102219 [Desulfonauticus submarinus]
MEHILAHYFYPLLRLVFFIALGIFIGNLIEALNWTKFLAKLSYPLIKFGRLKDISGASFSIAFFSGISANTILAEAYDQGKLNKKELILSNLFNSLPTYFLHLPTTFFIVAPFIKEATWPYFALTISAAFLRTIFTVFLAHFILPKTNISSTFHPTDQNKSESILKKTLIRFQKRFKKIILFTIPIYVGFKILAKYGFFHWLEGKLAGIIIYFPWLPAKSLGIIIMQMAAEFSAGLAAAGALLEAHVLDIKQIVLALTIGNILSSPIRAIRHQFPYYAGIYPPRLALILIIFNQSLRIISLALALFVYYNWF